MVHPQQETTIHIDNSTTGLMVNNSTQKKDQSDGYAFIFSTRWNPPGPLQSVLETKSNKFGRLFYQELSTSPSSPYATSIYTLSR